MLNLGLSRQVVVDRLFTGSHDGTIKVWDIFGIKEDAGLGQSNADEEDGDTQIILDDDYPYGDDDDGYYDEGMFLQSDTNLQDKRHKDVADIV